MQGDATSLDALIQTALLPDLQILRPLDSGDTANVYLAREPALNRLVAVKVLHPELAADPVARRRFEREAQSAARVSHPNVTTIHRVGRLPGDMPYMVMEYIDGRTVRDIVASAGALDYGHARTLLAAVAAALAAVHDRGIIHRDVRPGNVFVENRTGRAVLGDFGIAALVDSGAAPVTRLTAVGVRLGKTRYMSPEQIHGERLTEQSDIYAFGVLAYEVLSGRGPYDATGEAQMLVAQLQQQPRPLRDLHSDVDAGTGALIERCLAKEPNRRPRAHDLAVALTAAPSTAAPRDPDEGPLGQLLAELRRRRVYQVLVGYGAFALAVFGVGQGVDQAFPLSRFANQVLVVSTLAGFPAALMLSWIFDIRAGRIQRTRTVTASPRLRILMWASLGIIVLTMVVVGRLLLRGD